VCVSLCTSGTGSWWCVEESGSTAGGLAFSCLGRGEPRRRGQGSSAVGVRGEPTGAEEEGKRTLY
jgi:hypothetical protein